jgi:D-alanyl-D-alanine carboxypeptidase/D-alanyl-D-alanine-endopeptidase (penicillin-binding protein 4)
MNQKTLLPCFLLLMLYSPLFASDITSLQSILRVFGLKTEQVGIEVEDVHEVLLSINDRRPMIPASLTKIVTGAAALELLGPQYQFRTQLLTDGVLKNGLLQGSLYLKGCGDPSFTAEKLPALVEQLSAKNIKRIQGNLVVDNFRFQDPNFTSIDKVKHMIGSWDRKGYPLFVIMEPALTFAPLSEGRVRSIITPRKNRDFAVYLNMNQPDLWTGQKFLSLLKNAGIELSGRVERGRTPSSIELMAEVSSPLSGIVSQMMKASSNYYAEMLARNFAAEKNPNPVSTQQGMQRIQEFLDHVGIARSDYRIRSGAGFSKQNFISARNLLKVLNHMKEEKTIFPLFKNSFAVAGMDGTLEDRMKNTTARGKIFAKTGHLKGVVGLAGYAQRMDGTLLTFVFMYNGPRPSRIVETAFDRLCVSLLNTDTKKYATGESFDSPEVYNQHQVIGKRVQARK